MEELQKLIDQITVDTIADKIDAGCLWDWCLIWRTNAKEAIERIENERGK